MIKENNDTNGCVEYMHKIPKELRLTCSHECGYKLKFTQPPCNVTANKGNIISLK